MSKGFYLNLAPLEKGLVNMAKKDLAPFLKLETEATKLRRYAQQKAPWTDRTGRARQSLNTNVSTISKGYRIELAHGVDYGIWLEFAHERRFAIIMPAIQEQAPKIMKSFANFMERM